MQGRREGRKEGKKGMKKGRKEGSKEGRKEFLEAREALRPPPKPPSSSFRFCVKTAFVTQGLGNREFVKTVETSIVFDPRLFF